MSKAKIHYYDIGDYLSREDKLRIIKQFGSVENIPWTILEPNEHGDWINHRNEMFKDFIPIEPDKKFNVKAKSFFVVNSRGNETGRDAWMYNFSSFKVENNIDTLITEYNNNLGKKTINELNYDETRISWTSSLINKVLNGISINSEHNFSIGLYRPFCKEITYRGTDLIHRIGQMKQFFPNSEHKNLVICVSGLGGNKENSAYISNCIVDLNCLDAGTDWILTVARKQYGYKVTKEDIFYYVYGLLHSPDYRATFATDLKKSLPRLPLVEKADDFWAFSKAGRELADLHLNYETIEPYRKCIVSFAPLTNKGDKINYHVEKMRFGKIDSKTADKSVIYYNNSITITGIPAKAYEYVANGKSAIEWVMERYAITTDKKSGITNDPNDWAREHNDEKYILSLLLRVINVSVQTVEIVKGLPKLKFEE